jgi:hypothetical protein
MHPKCIQNHMENNQVSARVELSEYTNKVLGVLKAKHGLKDKSEAINKFTELYGDEIVEKESSEEYVKHILEVTNRHFKKYKDRRMTLEELDALCEI